MQICISCCRWKTLPRCTLGVGSILEVSRDRANVFVTPRASSINWPQNDGFPARLRSAPASFEISRGKRIHGTAAPELQILHSEEMKL